MAYEERQEDEVEFLQAVFPGDLADLRARDPWKVWRPPELLISLVPQKSMGGSAQGQRPVSIQLYAKYPTDYPDSPPELQLKEPMGLTTDQVKELQQEISQLARDRVGEVMMLEVAQAVQVYLHKHDRPLVSLHEEMVRRQLEEEERQRRREEREREEQRRREEEERRKLEEEIRRKKAELLERLEPLYEDSDEYLEDEEDSRGSVQLPPAAQLVTSTPLPPATPPKAAMTTQLGKPVRRVLLEDGSLRGTDRRHRFDKELQIQRGKCLGESSSGGHMIYVGMDTDSGNLLAVYEWTLHTRPTKRGGGGGGVEGGGGGGGRGDSRRLKQVASIQQEFDGYQQRGVSHGSLVQYLSMSYTHARNKIVVEVVMEYVGGGNLSSRLRNPDIVPVTGETLSLYSKQLLEAVSYLHSQGIVHNDIQPSLVFFDGAGGVKLGGFGIVKRLADLHRALSPPQTTPTSTTATEDGEGGGAWLLPWETRLSGGKKGDVLKLGLVLLCLALGRRDMGGFPPPLPPHLPDPLRDLLAKCLDTNEHRRYPAHDLLQHPFVSPAHPQGRTTPTKKTSGAGPRHTSTATTTTTTAAAGTHGWTTGGGGGGGGGGAMQFQRSDSLVGSPVRPAPHGRSRLETEFEELEVLGSGGFGDVIKIRNHLDGRLYALKKIRLHSDSKMMSRITREVELLSQMNHENVVRYYNAWIETYTEEEYKKHSGADLESSNESSSDEDDGDDEESHDLGCHDNMSSSGEDSPGSDYDYESDDSDHSNNADIANDISESFVVEFEESKSSVASVGSGEGVRLGRGEGVRLGRGGEEEDVFMDVFSDSDLSERMNFLGGLEAQVMNVPRFSKKSLPAESSDTVVFMDSSVPSTQPITIPTKDRRRERKKQKSDGQVQFLYIQMEYCENETLRHLIDSGDLHGNEDRVWRLLREIVEGLEHIHSKGMIHRDLKPGNIFLNSSGHIKIGDFGLATAYKQTGSKQSSILVPPVTSDTIRDGETGLVGTALYLAPELQKNFVKYSQKVDLYSVGIIFFEMCHAPPATAMERHLILLGVRQRDIVFPPSFNTEEKNKQVSVIRWLLTHSPHDRPTSKQLLQSPLLPLKMEDEELQEVLLRTLQATNSTRYRHLVDELFSQEASRVSEFSYFLDPQESKHGGQKKKKFSFWSRLLQQFVHSRLVSVFSRHGATPLAPPLLHPRSGLHRGAESVAEVMDRSGAIVSLPHDHRVPFARYVAHKDITYLKRYTLSPVYREHKVLGSHPRELHECHFDIVSPSPASLVPDAEVMYVVSELVSELPSLQESVCSVCVSHTSLLTALLAHCSIPTETHPTVMSILSRSVLSGGVLKSSDFEKRLKEKNVQLSLLAYKALYKYVSSEVNLSEAGSTLLDPLLRDRTVGVAECTSLALQEITSAVEHFRDFGGKENVFLCPGLCPAPPHFSGLVFSFVDTSSRRNVRTRRVALATGGRYDSLLKEFRRPGQSSSASSSQAPPPSVSVVGVSIREEALLQRVLQDSKAISSIAKCSVLVCWLGKDSLQKECIRLVRDLWSQGISADIVTEALELDNIEDIQEFCRTNFIPHIVILADKSLFFERKQIRVRTLESGNISEKIISTSELADFLQKTQGIERSDSTETREGGGATAESQTAHSSLPAVNVAMVWHSKQPGSVKRRYHDQALTKLYPLLQKFSLKVPLEVLVVDLSADVTCSLAAEVNKLVGSGEVKELLNVGRTVAESHSEVSKKYVTRVCESIQDLLLNKKPRVPVVFLYSHSAECCQTILNSLDSLAA